MGNDIHLTTDHHEIRRWVEDVGGRPARARIAASGAATDVPRLDIPGEAKNENLEPISWDDWFRKFDEAGLALLYEERGPDGSGSTFNKLVQRR
jgi:hypothetical protein